jgi:hypothetical protein
MDFDTQTLSRSPSCIPTRAKPQVTASWIPACLKSLVLGPRPPGPLPVGLPGTLLIRESRVGWAGLALTRMNS